MQAPPLPSTMYLLASYFRCVGFYHMQITPPTCSVHGGFGQERTPDSSWYAESLHMAAGTVLVLILPPFLGKSFYLSSASSNSPSELCCLIHAPSMGGVGSESFMGPRRVGHSCSHSSSSSAWSKRSRSLTASHCISVSFPSHPRS